MQSISRRRRDTDGDDPIDQDLLIWCAEIAQNIKREIKKCVDMELLPPRCRSAKKPILCDPKSRYSIIDGRCNNLLHPEWGMTGVTLLRWLTAHYADDISLFRRSVYGVPLPNPRNLSNELFSGRTLPDSNVSMLFVYFGLFLDHDMIFTRQSYLRNSLCCLKENIENSHRPHPECVNIEIHESDPFYGPHNVTCMGLLRDRSAIGDCPGRRENMNDMTSYIDCSDVYGKTKKESSNLRAFKNGELRTFKESNSALLPTDVNSGNCAALDKFCFLSGDVRVSMVLQLTTLHTVWFREHNRLAHELHLLNPKWDDERLFQEARRILIAELQYVTYREFLPIIFGQDRTKRYGLFPEVREEYNGYDENVDATIHNAFGTAAFRFGHALVQSHVEFRGDQYSTVRKQPLNEMYLNASILLNNGFDDLVRGMIAQKSKHVERYTTQEIRGRLFQLRGAEFGLDLTAITIHRGREHGIPSYVKFRKFCKLRVPSTWEDLLVFMRKEYVDSLRKLYLSIEDIDLLPGALGEHHVRGALLGPTYLCLIRKQFVALRKGDRFWFQNPYQPGSFTKEQLDEIYKSSFARVLCDVSDGLKMIPKFPFSIPSEENPVLPCGDIPKMDLTKWKEI